MSVYSGFATRQMETQYNQLIKMLLFILSKRISKIYTQKPCNEQAFRGVLMKVIYNMNSMEKYKYIEPKYSDMMINLLEVIDDPQKRLNTTQDDCKPPLPRKGLPAVEEDLGNFQKSIEQTQKQVTKLQENLNRFIDISKENNSQNLNNTQLTGTPYESDNNIRSGKPTTNNTTTPLHCFSHKQSQQQHEEPVQNGLRVEELKLLQNLIKERKTQKQKRRKFKKKRKTCTFEKLLQDFDTEISIVPCGSQDKQKMMFRTSNRSLTRNIRPRVQSLFQ